MPTSETVKGIASIAEPLEISVAITRQSSTTKSEWRKGYAAAIARPAMTLDPVHVDGIARLAGQITSAVDETEHRELAETVWDEFLDPLRADGTVVLEPLGEQERCRVDVQDAALQERPYPTQHGVDSGTINPTTFKNGVVLDVAHAAMASVPSDLALHRGRSVVLTAHTYDRTRDLSREWMADDEGYTRKRVLHAPCVDRYEHDVVHALALYLAESEHALEQADLVDDLLVLDGPIYPTGILQWTDHDPELANLLEEDDPREVLQNYLDLVERFVERDVPLVGFVKTTTSKALCRAVEDATGNAPWANDAAFLTQLLERTDGDDEPVTDELTCTNWFRSRAGTDGILAGEDALGLDRDLDPEAYDVTFFAIYDPREELLFRVEAPYAFTKHSDRRERLRRQLLADVAAERGPPEAVAKADELARIGAHEKQALRDAIEQRFESERQPTYNESRWGLAFDGIE